MIDCLGEFAAGIGEDNWSQMNADARRWGNKNRWNETIMGTRSFFWGGIGLRRWGFLLKMVPVLCLALSMPVFASGAGYGAIPSNYALGLLFVLSITLFFEPRVRSLGIISFFIGMVVLFSHLIARNNSFPEYSMFFIIPAAMVLLLGYMVIGRGLAKGTDDETETPVLSNITLLSVVALLFGGFCLLSSFFYIDSYNPLFFDFLTIPSSITVTASLLALRGIIRRNLDYEPQKIPFFYIFNKIIFKPVVYGFICALSVSFVLLIHNLNMLMLLACPLVIVAMVAVEYNRVKNRTANLPRLFSLDYCLLFFLSLVAGNGILLIVVLSLDYYCFHVALQCLLFLPSIAGFSYFVFTLITDKCRSLLSSTVRLLPCFPAILLIILNIAGVLPIEMHLSHTRCHSNLKNIGTALEMYSCDNDGRYPQKLKQLVPKYITEIPRCARVKEDSFAARYYKRVYGLSAGDYVYSTSDGRNRYKIYCSGNNHKDVGVGENYPQYSSDMGLTPK